MRRRGFTLVEVLVGLVLLGLVSAVLFQVIVGSQRVSRAQTARSEVQGSARAGALMLPGDFREIGFSNGPYSAANLSDIIAMSANSIQVRAQRGFGFTCGTLGGSLVVTVRTGPSTDPRVWQGLRQPAVGDRVLVFYDGANVNSATDDGWLPATVTGTAASSSACSSPSGSGLFLTLSPIGGTFTNYSWIRDGSPVRLYEEVQYSLYQESGRTWLGAQVTSQAGSSVQPVLGPLDGTSGLQFRYFDANGNQISDYSQVANVRSIEVQVNGASSQAVQRGGGFGSAVAQDTVRFTTRVALRNYMSY